MNDTDDAFLFYAISKITAATPGWVSVRQRLRNRRSWARFRPAHRRHHHRQPQGNRGHRTGIYQYCTTLNSAFLLGDLIAGMSPCCRSIACTSASATGSPSTMCSADPDGETVGLLGPNGAGKTTTLSMMSGLGQPDSGSVSFQGQLVRRMCPNDLKRRVGLVPQDLALYDELSAWANLELRRAVWTRGCRARETRRRRVGTGGLGKSPPPIWSSSSAVA